MIRTILLVRHGEVVGDAAQCFVGRTDLPMSTGGEAQVAALASALGDLPFDVVYCSDLRRSRRTAELLAAGRDVPVRIVPDLAEIDMGDWEGLPRRAVAAHRPQEYAARGRDIAGFHPPGGESFADLAARVLPCWRAIVAAPEPIVAVAGHAGVNRVILCDLLGMPLANLFRIAQTPGGATLIEIGRQGPVVRLLDATTPAPAITTTPNPRPDHVPEILRC